MINLLYDFMENVHYSPCQPMAQQLCTNKVIGLGRPTPIECESVY